MKKIIILKLLLLILTLGCKENNEQKMDGEIIPSTFIEGERIILHLLTSTKDTIEAYSDSGGGFTAIYPKTLENMGLKDKVKKDSSSSRNFILAKDVFANEKYFPHSTELNNRLSSDPYFIVPSEEFLSEVGIDQEEDQAFFGQYFYMRHCWTFDYLNQQVKINSNCNLDVNNKSVQKVGFKKDSLGRKINGHPSIYMKVEGEKIPVLFDTGATIVLSKSAQKALSTKEEIGGSFIARSVFDKWKKNHPDWKIIEKGNILPDGGRIYELDIIEVPVVELGGHKFGPAWFAVRPDEAWSRNMIRTMDKVVKGALGGSALKYTTVTIDYPNELIEFTK